MMFNSLNRPFLLLMLGYPGSGKTFFSRQYADEKKLPLISTDRLRFELEDNPSFSKDEDKRVAAVSDYMIEQYLKFDMSVIVDGLNSTRARRHNLREMARKYNANPVIIWVQTDPDTCFNRAQSRDRRQTDDKYTRSIDGETFDKDASAVKAPEHEEYIVISGKHVYANQRNAIDRKLVNFAVDSAKSKVERASSLGRSDGKKVSLGGRVDLGRRRHRLG